MSDLLKQLKTNIPRSLYEEFVYCYEKYPQGKVTKEQFAAVIQDALAEIRERQTYATPPTIIKRKTSGGTAYYLNRQNSEYPFSLLSEPTEEGFLTSYHDIVEEHEVYRPEDPLEQKGRIFKPIDLSPYPDFFLNSLGKTIGADIARRGDDKSVFIIQDGGHVVDVQAYFFQDIAETTGRLINCVNEHRPNEVILDITGGWGAGVHDFLLRADIPEIVEVTGVHFNQVPREQKWSAGNARAEMYFNLAERFRLGEITIPLHKALIEELSWIKYKFHAESGKVYIEPKEECKKINKRSPDHADALALAFYRSPNAQIFC